MDVVLGDGWERRALGEEELRELRRIREGMRRFPVRLFAATAFAAVAGAIRLADDGDSGWGAAILLAAAAALAVAWLRWVRGRKVAARLGEDLRTGWVARARLGDLAGTEVLPNSGARWADAGQPAAWRASAAARYR